MMWIFIWLLCSVIGAALFIHSWTRDFDLDTETLVWIVLFSLMAGPVAMISGAVVWIVESSIDHVPNKIWVKKRK